MCCGGSESRHGDPVGFSPGLPTRRENLRRFRVPRHRGRSCVWGESPRGVTIRPILVLYIHATFVFNRTLFILLSHTMPNKIFVYFEPSLLFTQFARPLMPSNAILQMPPAGTRWRMQGSSWRTCRNARHDLLRPFMSVFPCNIRGDEGIPF